MFSVISKVSKIITRQVLLLPQPTTAYYRKKRLTERIIGT